MIFFRLSGRLRNWCDRCVSRARCTGGSCDEEKEENKESSKSDKKLYQKLSRGISSWTRLNNQCNAPVSPASWCCGWKTKETLNHATRNSTRRCNQRSGFQCFYFNLQITESAARSLIDSERFLLSRFLFPQNSKCRVVKSLDRKSTTTTRKRESTQSNCDINSKRRFKRAPERKRIDNLLIRQIDKTKIQNCKGKSKTEVQKRAIRYWLPAAKETTPIIESEGPQTTAPIILPRRGWLSHTCISRRNLMFVGWRKRAGTCFSHGKQELRLSRMAKNMKKDA